MAASGTNLAITKDGETYNKLSRPDDYLISTQSPLPTASVASAPAIPGNKRKHEQESASETKRAKTDRNTSRSKNRTRAHEQFREPGVRSVLPGLEGEEQLTDESIDEAVAYLRSVRSEASAIPTLLVAPNNVPGASSDHGSNSRNSTNNTIGMQHAVYNDGTWVAVESESDGTSEYWNGNADNLDPQESCQWALIRRFCSIRSRLTALRKHKPRSEKVQSSRKTRRSDQSGKHHWAEAIDRDYPALEEVTQMDEPTLYVALHGCALALDRSTTISRQKSCWIWTLLALTGDSGTLDHERIGKIRDLGLAASRLLKRLHADRSSKEQHSLESGPGDNSASDCVTGDGSFTPDVDGSLESKEAVDEAGDSSAEMAISEDEADSSDAAEDGDLEKARARLLAQLGDRLVQPAIPPPDTPSDAPPMSNFQLLSRAEAERQRQETRNSQRQKEDAARASTFISDPAQTRDAERKSTPLTDNDLETKAAIDMILTVVAECYGQRDLLKFREAW